MRPPLSEAELGRRAQAALQEHDRRQRKRRYSPGRSQREMEQQLLREADDALRTDLQDMWDNPAELTDRERLILERKK